jgi:porin
MRRASLCALIALVALATHAGAQDALEQPGLLEQDKLSADWGGLRSRLIEHGLEPYLVYTGSMWSNLGGGIRTGTEFDGYLDVGFGLDLGKLGLWEGLELQASWHWFQGREPSRELVGVDLSQAVNPWEASNAIRFFDLYLSQRFGADGVVRAGQMAVDTDFMISRYAGVMLNAAFGDLPSQNLNLDVPVYPVAGPGVYVAGSFADGLAARFGAYTSDTPADVAGYRGLEWKLGNSAGYAFFAELSASASPAGLPGAYTVGGYFASVRQPSFHDPDDLVYAQWSGWLIADQALAVDDQGDPKVGSFARISYSPDDGRNVASIYADAGLIVYGAVPGRPDDALGFAGTVLRFTDDFRASTGEGSGEYVLEATYQIQVAPWLVVQPDLQYVIDPVFAADDATVAGLEVVVTF